MFGLTVENEFELTRSTREDTLRRIDLVFFSTGSKELTAAETSQIVVDGCRKVLRKINDLEIETLEKKCRCSCTSWANFFLLCDEGSSDENDISLDLQDLVSDTRFDATIILDLTTEGREDETSPPQPSPSLHSDWLRLPPGIHSNLLISDSILQLRSCRVYRNSVVKRTFVASHAVLINCGLVTVTDSSSGSPFSFGTLHVSVGPETGGGRPISLTAESTMLDVAQQLSSPPPTAPELQIGSTTAFNVLSNGSLVRDTPTLSNVYLYRNASIETACSVTNCLLFPKARIINSCVASNIIMQWNAIISDNSKVNCVFMMEESRCGPNSVVESTIMGPDSHASAGEIHASVVGPSTNAHHQSLIIGVLWPMGRGNVGYGANVGSNHTGRIPDQEAVAGEGIFWGLSCVVKFPIDLSSAPYTIVAAGVKLPPQRISMPFSLIVENSSGGPQNEIIPGWVLQSSPYTLVRCDKKYITRRKAMRHAHYTGWKILRPSTIEMCRSAQRLLESDSSENVQGLLGACVLTEKGRTIGIQAYRDCIHRYVLQGLLTWLILVTSDDENGNVNIALQHEFLMCNQPNTKSEDSASTSPTRTQVDKRVSAKEWTSITCDMNSSSVNEWEYQRRLLLEEFPIHTPLEIRSWLLILLQQLVTLECDFAQRVAKCKRRDDTRGAEIIPGYSDSHVSSDADPVVVDVVEKAKKTEAVVKALLAKIEK